MANRSDGQTQTSAQFLFELRASEKILCERFSAHPWWKLADALALEIVATTRLCATLALPTAEIKAFWHAHLSAFKVVIHMRQKWLSDEGERARLRSAWEGINQELVTSGVGSQHTRTQIILTREDWHHRGEMCRLQAAMVGFQKALYDRDRDSPQAKYAEAQLSSRRALMENHNPLLDGLPQLVEVLRKVCSHEAAQYILTEAAVNEDDYLDALHMLAHDGSVAEQVPNPPARLRSALSREQRRKKKLDRKKWMPPTPEESEAVEDLDEIESRAIMLVDWEHGRRDLALPADQELAVQARIDGLNLQSSEAPEYLRWSQSKLDSVRRSLEPDRRWGKMLRKRFADYRPENTENKQGKNS